MTSGAGRFKIVTPAAWFVRSWNCTFCGIFFFQQFFPVYSVLHLLLLLLLPLLHLLLMLFCLLLLLLLLFLLLLLPLKGPFQCTVTYLLRDTRG